MPQGKIEKATATSGSRPNRLGLNHFRRAISHFDRQESPDAFLRSRLQSLMFLVDPEQVEEVHTMLAEVSHPDRFQMIVASFFGRWTEIDLESARSRSLSTEHYPTSARQGVILTWMHLDARDCLEQLTLRSRDDDPAHVSEYLAIHSETHPAKAAQLVDAVAELWPDRTEHLLDVVGKSWCLRNPIDAVGWVDGYPDFQSKEQLLGQLLILAARNHGSKCLEALESIQDPALRDRFRAPTLRWWGISAGEGLVSFTEGTPPYSRPSAYPDSWSHDELREFVFGVMINNSHRIPDLVELASDQEQLHAVHEGILKGGAFAQPSQATDAVLALPDEMAESPEGERLLRKWVRRLSTLEPDQAASLVESLPLGLRRNIVLEEIRSEHPEP